MTPDIALVKHTLSVLKRIGPQGLAEHPLMQELEIACGRPLTTQEARDHILYCFDRGWIRSRRDIFERTVYWLSDAGQNTLAGM